jgi:hypothetical protein
MDPTSGHCILFTVHFKERLSNKRGPCIDELSIKDKFKSVTQKAGYDPYHGKSRIQIKKMRIQNAASKLVTQSQQLFQLQEPVKSQPKVCFSFISPSPTSETGDAHDSSSG